LTQNEIVLEGTRHLAVGSVALSAEGPKKFLASCDQVRPLFDIDDRREYFPVWYSADQSFEMLVSSPHHDSRCGDESNKPDAAMQIHDLS
jgi:hypothetical protein